MGTKCSSCSFDGNAPEWEFCGHCGADLSAAPAQQAVKKETSTPDEPVRVEPKVKAKREPVSTSSIKAKLVVIQRGEEGHEFAIEGDEAEIGRWDSDAGAFPDVDLSEDDPGSYVSRHHARIFIKNGRYFLEDLGSTNKTVVNKTNKLNPHSPIELKNGDEIIIGKTFLKFMIEY